MTAPNAGAATAPDNSSSRPASRLVIVVSVIGVLALVVRVVVAAAHPLANHDTWFNLSVGHRLWENWTLAPTQGLSRFATQAWVPTQWSTDMLMAKTEDWFGLAGVAWLFGALYVAFVLTVYQLCRRRAPVLPSALALGATMVASAGMFSARPQVVSLLLFTLTFGAWLATVDDGRPRWWLVPLTWFWATAHGLWSAGVILGLVVCVGLALDKRHRRGAARLLAVPALSLMAALVTPAGPRLITSQLAVAARSSLITEWRPTSFREPAALMVVAMVGVVVVRWARHGGMSWTHLVLLVTACGWAAVITRMVPFAAVLLAPMAADVLARVTDPGRGTIAQRRFERWAVLGGSAMALLILALVVPNTATRPGNVPATFGARLDQLPSGSAVLVEDTIGSWIEWRDPELNPVIDGLFDAFPVEYLGEFADARAVKPGWRQFVVDSGATVAILERGSPLTTAVRQELEWRASGADGRWVYLVAPG